MSERTPPQKKAAQYDKLGQVRRAEEGAEDTAIRPVGGDTPEVDAIATPDAQTQAPPEPLVGNALDADGKEVEQVGKHPDLPADVPVTPGTALDPSLPPLQPHTAVLE